MKWIALLYILTNSYGSNGWAVVPVPVESREACLAVLKSHLQVFPGRTRARCVQVKK